MTFLRGRGAALADFNQDGLLDLVEVKLQGTRCSNLSQCRAGSAAETCARVGHWLALRLTEEGLNRDAIGAWVEVRVGSVTVQREVTVGGGHAGGQRGWKHVGLGPADGASVRVQWPDGETGPWIDVGADGFWVIERGQTDARPFLP